MTSPVVDKSGQVATSYTCDGEDISLPLKWTGIPAGISELLLVVLKLQPVNNKLYFAWAVAGLNPASQGLAAGMLPTGAFEGLNGAGKVGYTLCPPKGSSEKYIVVLYALPRSLGLKPGFDPAAARLQAIHDARYQGFMFASYSR